MVGFLSFLKYVLLSHILKYFHAIDRRKTYLKGYYFCCCPGLSAFQTGRWGVQQQGRKFLFSPPIPPRSKLVDNYGMAAKGVWSSGLTYGIFTALADGQFSHCPLQCRECSLYCRKLEAVRQPWLNQGEKERGAAEAGAGPEEGAKEEATFLLA